MQKSALMGLMCWALLASCQKVTPPQWLRVTPGDDCSSAGTAAAPTAVCSATIFFVDTAHVEPKGGLLYVTMQTRSPADTSGDYGIIHAEANCSTSHLDPTALHEERFNRAGQRLEMRLTPAPADVEAAVVQLACGGRKH